MPIKPYIDPFPKAGQPFYVNFGSNEDATGTVSVLVGDVERTFLLDDDDDPSVDVPSGLPVRRKISGYGPATANDRVTLRVAPGDGPGGVGVDSKVFI
ncbi:MAG: hypothetical protein KF850_15640 [Labilithrix sp.]|nr:hypothetical protein [Labilithrix sp.]MBX3213470.1 hypothetical protein [Labilithrix sp.]